MKFCLGMRNKEGKSMLGGMPITEKVLGLS